MSVENPQQDPTIIIDDETQRAEIEILKEKLRYKQALRENQRTIDHKQVRLSIQADALPTKTFFIMNGLSAVIAGYGLLANSSAVVIGAMLVAMMIGPISGVALAIIDNRLILLKTSLKTLFLGVLMIFGIGFLLGLIHYQMSITAEMTARASPNLLDLMIALAGGAAGAYAAISPRLSVAVVGVAVATALVPPLVASGIFFAHLNWLSGLHALLLACTNMVAIQFSASLVMWLAGFKRGKQAEITLFSFIKRNAITLILLVILAIYLLLNLIHSVSQQIYQNHVSQILQENLVYKNQNIESIKFIKQQKQTLVHITLIGDQLPTSQNIVKLSRLLPRDQSSHPTQLSVQFIPAVSVVSQQ